MKIKKVVEVEVEIKKGDVFESSDPDFKELVRKFILECSFIGGSCHDNIKNYFGMEQGGSNTCGITKLIILDVCETYRKITVEVDWVKSVGIFIVRY